MFKKSWKLPVLVPAVAAIALFYFTSCEKTETQTPVENAATLHLYLTDNPADYQAVWIDIQQVMIHLSGDTTQEGGWQEVPLLHPGRYDLLNLRNGNDTLLASADVPAGELSEIRLLLGDDNTVVFNNGDSVGLFVPSGQESGLKLKVEDMSLEPGDPFELVLDFDVARSIIETGNPDTADYILKPVIRIFARGAGASISGWVFPDSAHAHVMAIGAVSHDTLSTIPDLNGYYKFWGIQEDSYKLLFLADTATGYKNDTLESIQALTGEVIKADTVRLQK